MPRAIVGFQQDEDGNWVATLACGHRQHMRHNPPFTERAWVTSEAGRRVHIGLEVPCADCRDGPPVRLERRDRPSRA